MNRRQLFKGPSMSGIDLGFPVWVRATHWFNFLFLTMLVRSGLEILSSHPKLYWNNDSLPGSEWQIGRAHV